MEVTAVDTLTGEMYVVDVEEEDTVAKLRRRVFEAVRIGCGQDAALWDVQLLIDNITESSRVCDTALSAGASIAFHTTMCPIKTPARYGIAKQRHYLFSSPPTSGLCYCLTSDGSHVVAFIAGSLQVWSTSFALRICIDTSSSDTWAHSFTSLSAIPNAVLASCSTCNGIHKINTSDWSTTVIHKEEDIERFGALSLSRDGASLIGTIYPPHIFTMSVSTLDVERCVWNRGEYGALLDVQWGRDGRVVCMTDRNILSGRIENARWVEEHRVGRYAQAIHVTEEGVVVAVVAEGVAVMSERLEVLAMLEGQPNVRHLTSSQCGARLFTAGDTSIRVYSIPSGEVIALSERSVPADRGHALLQVSPCGAFIFEMRSDAVSVIKTSSLDTVEGESEPQWENFEALSEFVAGL